MVGIPIPSALLDEEAVGEDLDNEKSFDKEFFLKRDKDVSWADEDFWECAWIVTDEAEEGGWPTWINEEIKEKVVEAGKARGLLRGLKDGDIGTKGMRKWKGLAEIIAIDCEKGMILDLMKEIQDFIGPICDLVLLEMRSILDVECGLMEHLNAIEGNIYLRSWGVGEEWSNWLYDQVSHWISFVLQWIYGVG